MRYNKAILREIIACIALGVILGIAFWLFDGGRTCKKTSECPLWHPVDNSKATKVYQGRWHKTYLEVIGK